MGDCACDVSTAQLTEDAPRTHIFLELLSACNSACPGCGNVSRFATHSAPLALGEWCHLIDTLAQHNLHLRITGGEPTLHPDFTAIIEHVESCNLRYTLFTNARWNDPQQVITMLTGSNNLECILISLHGASARTHEVFTATPGSFEETINNIRAASRAGIPMTSSTVITSENHCELPAIIALARSLGMGRSTVSRFIGPRQPGITPTQQQLAMAVETLDGMMKADETETGTPVLRFGSPVPRCFTTNHSNGCMAGVVHATIDSYGNLRPCTHVPISAGSALTTDLDELWNAPMMKQWRASLFAQCAGCALVNECRSACLAEAYWNAQEVDPLIRRPDRRSESSGDTSWDEAATVPVEMHYELVER